MTDHLDPCEQLNHRLKSNLWPIFDRLELNEEGVELEFTVDPKLACFKGHFPQQALLPGVIQVHWVGELSKQLFNAEVFTSMQKVKFINVVLPGQRLKLSIDFESSKKALSFVYTDSADFAPRIISSGILKFDNLSSGGQ